MAEYQHVCHEFPPEWDAESRILILGSFPSVKSREEQFYYGHPQNRFWKVLAAVYAQEVPNTIEGKKGFLHRNHIALWDVIESCDIIGSADSSIKNAVPADVASLLQKAPISRIFVNGSLAKKLYDRYTLSQTGLEAVKLPSTSPANARFSLEKLIMQWRVICSDLPWQKS